MKHACPKCGTTTTRPGRCATCMRPENKAKAARPSYVQVYGTKRWRTLRATVIRRDGGTCQRCGKPGTHAAHRTPFVDGNDPNAWALSNVQCECATCNGSEAAVRRHARPRPAA